MSEVSVIRVLAVVSEDFGEFGMAMYLLDGTNACARLLLPPRLYQQNPALNPHSVASYGCASDITRELLHYRPQILLLMSAYLFGVGGLLKLHDLVEILRQAKGQGAAVATSDPFLGLMLSPTQHKFSDQHGAELQRHFVDLQGILGGLPHVYMAPIPPGPGKKAFFNPRAVISGEEKSKLMDSLKQKPLSLAERPHWLFVISREDYQHLCTLRGRTKVEGMLLNIMQKCVLADRTAVLIAPAEVCQSLAGRTPQSVTLLPFCGYAVYRALLLTAEHVFFWNLLSNSYCLRMANFGSTFFFDVGHLARYFPAVFPLFLHWFCGNIQPPLLDLDDALSTIVLAQHAKNQLDTFAPLRSAYTSLASPDAMLASLLRTEQ